MKRLLELLKPRARIPGLNTKGDGEWRYVLASPTETRRTAFVRLQKAISRLETRAATSGAMGETGATITLPDGRVFVGIYYRKDLDGWRSDVETACAANDMTLAQFVGRKFVVGIDAPLPLSKIVFRQD